MEFSEDEINSWFSNYEKKNGVVKSFADLYNLARSIQTEMPIGSRSSFILSKWLTDFYINTVNTMSEETDVPKLTNKVDISNDPVNHPSHYTNDGIECIDAMQASMTTEEFRGFLKGNAFKYLWRYRNKNNPSEDLKKAEWYLHKLIDQVTTDILNESDDNGV